MFCFTSAIRAILATSIKQANACPNYDDRYSQLYAISNITLLMHKGNILNNDEATKFLTTIRDFLDIAHKKRLKELKIRCDINERNLQRFKIMKKKLGAGAQNQIKNINK